MNSDLIQHALHASSILKSRLPISPLIEVAAWSSADGRRVSIKAENLMPTGSFKIRGATYRIATLTDIQKSHGVVAYSTGNHAQAVAKAAQDAGVSATIVMSPDVPQLKIAATKAWGAEVVMAEPSSNARRALAEEIAERQGKILIPPYDDLGVIAGQATIGVELVQQWGSTPPAAVFVPIGGGGLLSGVAIAIKHFAPEVKVIGVEPELEDDAARSFRSGQIYTHPGPSSSIADAIKVQRLGDITFPLIRQFVDDVVTVSENEIAEATLRCVSDAHLVVEPGGAVGIAAARKYQGDQPLSRGVIALACGGNISLQQLENLRQRFTEVI
jgi:threonine dehydratase